MIIWVDAQLSPTIARWITETLGVDAKPVRDLGLREASDPVILAAARLAGAVIMTKDNDFVELQRSRHGPVPIILLTCGNTSNGRLKEILAARLLDACGKIEAGELRVEIHDEFH